MPSARSNTLISRFFGVSTFIKRSMRGLNLESLDCVSIIMTQQIKCSHQALGCPESPWGGKATFQLCQVMNCSLLVSKLEGWASGVLKVQSVLCCWLKMELLTSMAPQQELLESVYKPLLLSPCCQFHSINYETVSQWGWTQSQGKKSWRGFYPPCDLPESGIEYNQPHWTEFVNLCRLPMNFLYTLKEQKPCLGCTRSVHCIEIFQLYTSPPNSTQTGQNTSGC